MTKTTAITITLGVAAILIGARHAKHAAAQGVGALAQQPSGAMDSARMAGMADHAMSGPMDENMMKHMELTPVRAATHGDTARAMHLAGALGRAVLPDRKIPDQVIPTLMITVVRVMARGPRAKR